METLLQLQLSMCPPFYSQQQNRNHHRYVAFCKVPLISTIYVDFQPLPKAGRQVHPILLTIQANKMLIIFDLIQKLKTTGELGVLL